jgi:D-xylose transport system permease protein
MAVDQPQLEPTAGAPAPLWLDAFTRRLRSGEVGSAPVIAGLVVIWAVFWYLNPNFLSPRNLTNLVLQIAAMGVICVGIVLVLLLGEIDLSVGAVSGLAAAVMAVLNVKQGVNPVIAIVVGILTGLAIGLLQGTWFTVLKIPSFVVTLAGLLAWQGLLLLVLGQTGTINIYSPLIDHLTDTFMPQLVGWAVAIAAVAAYAGANLARRWRRRQEGLAVGSGLGLALRIAVAAAIVLAITAVLNSDRGVPLAALILVGLVVVFDFIARRTRFGRYVFAVGGNAEAARRAGISVPRIRIAVFGLAGALAACGGIIAASRLLAVNQSSGGSDLLLDTIAAAVIGGTSLFGGRGTVWAAITGALVIGSISNGMDLLALASSIKFIVTGAVLLAAVTIDGLARQGRQASGRA